jgi:predicted transglutaminase-like cysteine proteinase
MRLQGEANMQSNWRQGIRATLTLVGVVLAMQCQPARASIDPADLSEKPAGLAENGTTEPGKVLTRFMLQANALQPLSTPWSDPEATGSSSNLVDAPLLAPQWQKSSGIQFANVLYQPFLPFLQNLPGMLQQQPPVSSDGIPKQVFGSVAISVSNSIHAEKWKQILAEQGDNILKAPCETLRQGCSNPRLQQARAVVREARGLDRNAKARLINRFVNETIQYMTDIENYGELDHWATLTETMNKGRGDCEDIAIVKMWMLKASGIDSSDLHLLIGKHIKLHQDHAILVVRADTDQNFYLDNLSNKIIYSSAEASMQPLLSYGTRGTWLHGYQKARLETK